MNINELCDSVFDTVTNYIERCFVPVRERFDALEDAIKAIPQGERGEKGDKGERGDKGDLGLPGERGAPGEKGLDGKDGRDGRDGKDGKDGRDGIATADELKALVEAEVAKRVAELVPQKVAEAFAALPKIDYRGVYKEGETYQKGNFATWGGSVWHCDEETTLKPGVGPWTLAVKRGRDGK